MQLMFRVYGISDVCLFRKFWVTCATCNSYNVILFDEHYCLSPTYVFSENFNAFHPFWIAGQIVFPLYKFLDLLTMNPMEGEGLLVV